MTEDVTVITVNGMTGWYVYDYEYQTCFDDGGTGHESWWSKARNQPLTGVYTEKAAIDKAKSLVNKSSGKHPCNGSFCDNKGLHRLVAVRFQPIPVPDVTIWPR